MIAISSTSLTRASRNRQLLSKPQGKEVGKKEDQEKEKEERRDCWGKMTTAESSSGEVILFELQAEEGGDKLALLGSSCVTAGEGSVLELQAANRDN